MNIGGFPVPSSFEPDVRDLLSGYRSGRVRAGISDDLLLLVVVEKDGEIETLEVDKAVGSRRRRFPYLEALEQCLEACVLQSQVPVSEIREGYDIPYEGTPLPRKLS